MTKLDTSQGQGVAAPIQKHSSSTVKAVVPAGGEVPVSDYANKTPGQADQRR